MSSALDHVFKILLVGDTQVGKSSILLKFTDGYFNPKLQSTIGVDFKVKVIDSQDPNNVSKRIKMTIWDTAGQERFRTLTSSYYRGAQGIIIVFDVTNKESFTSLGMWLQEVEQFSMGGGKEVIKYLVGNKSDEGTRQITTQEATNYAADRGLKYLEVSSKLDTNISELFLSLAKEIVAKVAVNDTVFGTTTVPAAARKAAPPADVTPAESTGDSIAIPAPTEMMGIRVTCPLAPRLSGLYRMNEKMVYFMHTGGKYVLFKQENNQLAIMDGLKFCAVSSPAAGPEDLPKAFWKVLVGDAYQVCVGMTTELDRDVSATTEGSTDTPNLIPDTAAASLTDRCEAILRQAAGVEAFREWHQRKEGIDSRLQAAKCARPKSYELISSVGLELQAVRAEEAALALTEDLYHTLSQRREAMLQELEQTCENLEESEEFAQLASAAAALSTLQALVLDTPVGVPSLPLIRSSIAESSDCLDPVAP